MPFFALIAVIGITVALAYRNLPRLPLSPTVGEIVAGMQSDTRPLSVDLEHAAQLVESKGYYQTADALRDRADIAQSVEVAKNRDLESPIAGVGTIAWKIFVALFKGKDVGEISASYQFGLFNIGYRRLADLGLADNVRRGIHNDRTVWFGRMIPPLTLERFLRDPVFQYRVFCKDMADRAAIVRGQHAEIIGIEIEGISASLSGLLAVAKIAGTAGLASWIKDPLERKKFDQTTAAFKSANGIF